MTWTPPDLHGRTYAVTGGNAGIGRSITAQLTGAGAEVVVLARRQATVELDLRDLGSVAGAAKRLSERDRLDGLILNAGTDSDEHAFTTNHLGHFALTALTMPVLAVTPGSRVVSIGSIMTRTTGFKPEDVRKTYPQSKHAVLLFTAELDRRLRASDVDVRALAAHPGLAVEGLRLRWPVQGKDRGAWPAVRAATDPDATGGQYYGPRFGTAGSPVVVSPPRYDQDSAVRLWTLSEQLTGITFDIPAGTR